MKPGERLEQRRVVDGGGHDELADQPQIVSLKSPV